MMRKIRYALAALCCGFGFSALAEGAGSDVGQQLNTQFTAVTTNMTTLKDSLVSWMQAFLPVLLGIVAVFIGLWLLRFAIRLVKSMGSASK